MYRHFLTAILLSLVPGLINSATAQRLIVLPKVPSGEVDDVHFIARIPAEKEQAVREIFQCVPQVGFLYRSHFFVLTYGHSQGRFVLYDQDLCWEVPQEMLHELLGPQAAILLVIPSWYGYPAGFYIYLALGGLVALGIGALVVMVVRDLFKDRREKRWRALSQDEQYMTAMSKYLEQVPASLAASQEQHQQGIERGVEYLVDHGIGARQARKQLLGLLQMAALDRVDDLKTQADQLAESHRWEEAAKLYQEAEAVVYHISPVRAKMMKQCIKWCEGEFLKSNRLETPAPSQAQISEERPAEENHDR